MPLPRGLPVVDHHCHLSPSGEGVDAARRFARAGGTHLFLTTQSYTPDPPRTLEDYRAQFETTERLAERVRGETGLGVFVVLAPYPIDLVAAVAAVGPSAAVDAHRAALDLAGRWVRERRAVALGEVGRAHFPVPPEVAPLIEETFRYAFAVAHDADCPIVVHSADLDPTGFRELAARARESGVEPGRVVKHFARSRVPASETDGVVPSYLAKRELVRQVEHDPGPWFLETDFLDDPRRPGAVLDLATVPRRAEAIAAAGTGAEERLSVPFLRSVEQVYRVKLEGRGPTAP